MTSTLTQANNTQGRITDVASSMANYPADAFSGSSSKIRLQSEEGKHLSQAEIASSSVVTAHGF